MVRDCRQEYERRRGFVRVFPSHDSWDLYRCAPYGPSLLHALHHYDVILSSFLEGKGRLNLTLHQQLYPGK